MAHEEQWERWRLFEDNWALRGSVKGLRALRKQHHDVALLHTQSIGLLSTDVSPIQMDALAEAYGHRVGRIGATRPRRPPVDINGSSSDTTSPPTAVQPTLSRSRPGQVLFAGGDLIRKGFSGGVDSKRHNHPSARKGDAHPSLWPVPDSIGSSGLVSRIAADPPPVHHMGDGSMGSWATEDGCYELIAGLTGPGTRSLEVGSGVSTVIIAARGGFHWVVTPFASEIAALRPYCEQREISLERVTFVEERSEVALPVLDVWGLDLALIDGNHGFPVPMSDFLHAGSRLRRGGVLVLDDLQLPTVRLVASFCDLDPRWARVACTDKWGAWERQDEGPLHDDHVDQPFLPGGWLADEAPFTVQVRRIARHGARGVRKRLPKLWRGVSAQLRRAEVTGAAGHDAESRTPSSR